MIKLTKIIQSYVDTENGYEPEEAHIEHLEAEDAEELKRLLEEYPLCSSSHITGDASRIWVFDNGIQDLLTGCPAEESLHLDTTFQQTDEAKKIWANVLKTKYNLK